VYIYILYAYILYIPIYIYIHLHIESDINVAMKEANVIVRKLNLYVSVFNKIYLIIYAIVKNNSSYK